MCVYVCVHAITQLTGLLAVITAEFIVITEWAKNTDPPPTFCTMTGRQNSIPFYDWFPPSFPFLLLVVPGLLPGYIRSSCI